MPSVEIIAERFSHLGIDDKVQVVAYDTSQGQMAARLWWMLRYLGHDAAAVLDGGLQSWKAAGLPLASGERAPRAAALHRAPAGIDANRYRGARARADRASPHRRPGAGTLPRRGRALRPGEGPHPRSAQSSDGGEPHGRGRFLLAEELRARFQSILGSRSDRLGSLLLRIGSHRLSQSSRHGRRRTSRRRGSIPDRGPSGARTKNAPSRERRKEGYEAARSVDAAFSLRSSRRPTRPSGSSRS